MNVISGYHQGERKDPSQVLACCLLRSAHVCPAPTKIRRCALLTLCLSGLRAGRAMTQPQTKRPMTVEIRVHRVTGARGDNTAGLSPLAPVCSGFQLVPCCLRSPALTQTRTYRGWRLDGFSHGRGTDCLRHGTVRCTEKER